MNYLKMLHSLVLDTRVWPSYRQVQGNFSRWLFLCTSQTRLVRTTVSSFYNSRAGHANLTKLYSSSGYILIKRIKTAWTQHPIWGPVLCVKERYFHITKEVGGDMKGHPVMPLERRTKSLTSGSTTVIIITTISNLFLALSLTMESAKTVWGTK